MQLLQRFAKRREQAHVVAKLRAKGADVRYDSYWRNLSPKFSIYNSILRATSKLIGEDIAERVVELTLRGSQVDDETMALVSRLTDMQSLRVLDARIADTGISCVNSLRGLESLEFTRCQISDGGLSQLGTFPRLCSLVLNKVPIDGSGLACLGRLPLTELFLVDVPLRTSATAHLRQLAHLRTLYLANRAIDDGVFQHIGGMKELSLLSLDNSQVTGTNIQLLDGMCLEMLSLAGSCVTDMGLSRMFSAETIQTLLIDSTAIGDRGLSEIHRLKHLRWLGARKTSLSDEGIKLLANLPELSYLDVRETNVTEGCIDYLCEAKALGEVCIAGTQIGHAGVKRLYELRPDLKVII